jgi:hypothetical protein
VPLTATYPAIDETITSGRALTAGHPQVAPKLFCDNTGLTATTESAAEANNLNKFFDFIFFSFLFFTIFYIYTQQI